MKLQECTTVKDCYMWAESIWPGFWDFATQRNMLTEEELTELNDNINRNSTLYIEFIDKIRELASKDKSKENIKYLRLGAGAFKRIQGDSYEN